MFPFRLESLPQISGGESGRGKAQLFGGLGAPSLVFSSNASLGAAVKDSADRTEVDFELIK